MKTVSKHIYQRNTVKLDLWTKIMKIHELSIHLGRQVKNYKCNDMVINSKIYIWVQQQNNFCSLKNKKLSTKLKAYESDKYKAESHKCNELCYYMLYLTSHQRSISWQKMYTIIGNYNLLGFRWSLVTFSVTKPERYVLMCSQKAEGKQ